MKPESPQLGATDSSRSYQQIRWSLLDARDRLRETRPQTFRSDLARLSLTLIIYLFSIPIYLTPRAQNGFSRYARRREGVYVDSYSRFKKNAQWTIGAAVVTIIAVGLATTAATFLRKKTTPAAESKHVFQVGILERLTTLEPMVTSFKRGLSERGYSEGERIVYDEQVNAGDETALVAVTQKFVNQKKDLILAIGDAASLAVKKGTLKINIPTVFYANFDPVEEGLIKSYARSENNLVGVGDGALIGQQLELLKHIAPTVHTIGVMSVATDGTNQGFIKALKKNAADTAFTIRTESITSADDIPHTLDVLATAGISIVYLAPSALTAPRLADVAQQALARKMILIGNSEKNAAAGALVALLADVNTVGRQLAAQADQIFHGALPSQISSQFPLASTLALNLKTAVTLNITIPPDIIERADVKY